MAWHPSFDMDVYASSGAGETMTPQKRNVIGRGSSFGDVNHSKNFIAMQASGLAVKPRLTLEQFQKKHEAEFNEMFGEDNEEEMLKYREMLDGERAGKLARGRNHAKLKEQLEKEKAKASKVKKQTKAEKLQDKLTRLRARSARRVQALKSGGELAKVIDDDSASDSGSSSELSSSSDEDKRKANLSSKRRAKAKLRRTKKSKLAVKKEGTEGEKGQPQGARDCGKESEGQEDEDSKKFLLSKFHDEEDSSSGGSDEDRWTSGWGLDAAEPTDRVNAVANALAAAAAVQAPVMHNAVSAVPWASTRLSLRSARLYIARRGAS